MTNSLQALCFVCFSVEVRVRDTVRALSSLQGDAGGVASERQESSHNICVDVSFNVDDTVCFILITIIIIIIIIIIIRHGLNKVGSAGGLREGAEEVSAHAGDVADVVA